MILTESSSARVGASVVTAIASSTAGFRHFLCYASTTISSAISGAIGLIKNGAGNLTLSGICDYTGPTEINAGSLTITSASTLNGVISGSGSLIKSGTATPLTLGGNNTYSGGTSQADNAITIVCLSSNALGTGLFTSTAGGVGTIIRTPYNIVLPNDFTTSGILQFRIDTVSTEATVTGGISGSGGLNKTSNGVLVLSGNLTYAGATTITAGTIKVSKTTGASTGTATFRASTLSVSFNVAPPTGTTTFKFFPGATTNSYASVTLTGVSAGTTATYNSANSTLTVVKP